MTLKMPTRRPHKKSRLGCVPCKKAHVKCDQKRPVCSNCTRHERPCEYVSIIRSKVPDEPGSSGTPASQADSVSGGSSIGGSSLAASGSGNISGDPLHNEFTFEDLELVHHYTITTSLSLHESGYKLNDMWRMEIPRIGMKHPYLLHGILAFTALHKASLGVDKVASLTHATRHRHYALTQGNDQLVNWDTENAGILLCFSGIISLYSFGYPLAAEGKAPDDSVQELVEIARLIQGSKIIAKQGYDKITSGPMAAMVQRDFGGEDIVEEGLSPEAAASFAQLEKRILEEDEAIRSIMDYPLRKLVSAYSKMVSAGVDRGITFSWLAVVEPSIISLIESKHPAALALTAHYAVMLHRLKEKWFMNGWGVWLIDEIYETIPDVWKSTVDWPRREILSH